MGLVFLACAGQSDDDVTEMEELPAETTAGAGPQLEKDTVHIDLRDETFKMHPCDVVTEEYIRSLFRVDEKTFRANRMTDGYPNCFYTWKGEDTKIMTVREGGKLEVPIQCAESVTVVDRPVSLSMYQESVRSIPDKLKDLAIGDQCVWSDQRRQLTARKEQQMFHVHVDCYNDLSRNQKLAEQIARKVLAEMIESGG